MKILITGINGFVGQHLAQYILTQTDDKIFGLDFKKTELNLDNTISTRVLVYATDLLNADQVIQTISAIQPDRIFHLAARTSVPESYTNQPATLMTNIFGTVNLLDAVRQANLTQCRIIVSCSSDQYGKVASEE